ncbi:ATP-binding cassette domain-containing protein [Devosia sp. ZB163]|uniref:ABC transporter ATP-binding protein n=1 Tax=Devosia sp. ZB163 TaxID=3025938 RepID=UPI0023602903|nr:oligopeptide/dipeptide ABC transporter ATP-binding protein [Devosia sp. ZB163]MDC9825815.1 ATP-binding cassette domain-containing protein [Devosia sp. ZB163]
MTSPLLSVDGLSKHFPVESSDWLAPRQTLRAVDGVSFTLGSRETLGLVGESGCGKSTTGRLILRLIEPTAGTVQFDGQDLATIPKEDLRRLRRSMQIIFQDPQASLNPRHRVEDLILEPLYAQGEAPSAELTRYAGDLLEKVGLSRRHLSRFPHEFSGGQRQRIGIARAIAPKPRLIICDEAVSALDVSVQAQVINLLQDLQDELGMSYLFIGHDLAVVRHVADTMAVMYLGRIVEMAPKDALYRQPMHPYTQALLGSVPVSHPSRRRDRKRLEGEIPSPLNPPSGCHFHPRCRFAQSICKLEAPALRTVAPGQQAACHFAEQIAAATP